MNRRNSLILGAWLVCAGSVSAVLLQQSEVSGLRVCRQPAREIGTQESNSSNASVASMAADAVSEEGSRELLQLRSEVTKLTLRKRELAGVEKISEQLRAQLAGALADSSAKPLPPGYLRKANAQWLGCATPENTLQSWLWAVAHHDFNKLLQTLVPEEARNAQASMARDPDSVFQDLEVIPGIGIQGRQALADGSAVQLETYVSPGMPTQKIELRLVNGEWKIGRW